MQAKLTELLAERLNDAKAELKAQFNHKHPIKVARHFALDNLLPAEIAEQVHAEFPLPKKMRMLKNYGELKLKFSSIKNTSSLIQDLHMAFQDRSVIQAIEEITGIPDQFPDPSPHAGGVSTLLKGYFINPHIDNSHDMSKKFYRTVNLLYYVSPNWQRENGGNYELWDEAVENHILVPSFFNRLVVMETNRTSWHAVNPVVCDAARRCMFNYYFSEKSPEGVDYFHGARSLLYNPVFKARPEQKFRRATARFIEKIVHKFR